ncbi:MAG: hypothetical protein OIF50_15030 [Flavobacteriaceae bacterium]|nr:hypothetical protein [Flavobacteriaceae bacterium]
MKWTNTNIIVLILIFGCFSCKTKNKTEPLADQTTLNVSANLDVDHLNIWVKNPKKAKEKLVDIGFTAVPDSLSEIHHGQGTTGRYFHFLNGYLELIFVFNPTVFERNNAINKHVDFLERANFAQNGALPFGIALKSEDYKPEKIPFEKVWYHQDWMGKNNGIYAAKNSKTNLGEPSIFVVYPEIESRTFESLSKLENFPGEEDYWKAFFKHPNGAKKISKIMITSNHLNVKTQTIRALNNMDNVVIKKGSEQLMELYFDDTIQGKSFDLRPELPLIIYL